MAEDDDGGLFGILGSSRDAIDDAIGSVGSDATTDNSDPTFSAIAPEEIAENLGFLKTFVQYPRQTILGVIGSAIIGGVVGLWEIFLDGITLVLWGDSLATTEGTIGLLDLPLVLLNTAEGAFSAVGADLLAPLAAVYSGASGTIESLGLLAWPAGVATIVVVVVLFDRAFRRTTRATLAAIPIIGPFLEVLFR
jgi:hypothetical protein